MEIHNDIISGLRAGNKGIGLVILLFIVMFVPVLALEPPTQEQVAAYKADGSWPARTAMAKSYGNHKLSKETIARVRQKLRMIAAQAAEKVSKETASKTPPTGWQNMPTTGTVRIPVFLIAFSDYPAYNDAADVENKIFDNGDPDAFPYESLHSYYDRSSYNQLDIQGDVYGWYTTTYPRSDVGTDRVGREALIREVVEHYDTEGGDFSVYDNDGNGTIDYFAIIWTGPHGEWAEFWWGYQTHFYDNTFVVDGVILDAYSWQWETYNYPQTYDAGIEPSEVAFSPKTLIHETGHALGLPDYYDYDDSVGPVGGIGGLDIMAGSWGDHNCFSKFVLDWITPEVIAKGQKVMTFQSAATTGEALIIMPDIAGNTPFDEFFMVQNRYREANDTLYPTDGLLIWHVNAELDSAGYDYVYDNSYSEHKLLRLMEADGLEEIEQDLWADAGDFYKSGDVFSPISNPNSNCYDGSSSRVWIKEISAPGETMVFTAKLEGIPAYMPHFTLREGIWSTRLTLTNDDDADGGVVDLTAFDEDGNEVAQATVEIPEGGGVSSLVGNMFSSSIPEKGWLQIGIPSKKVTGLMTFQYLPTGASSSLPLTYESGTRLVFPLIEFVDGRTTGFAIVNLSDQNADVRIQLCNMDGSPAGSFRVNVKAHGKLVEMLDNMFTGPMPERSILKVSSDAQVTGFALIFTSGNTNVIAVPATVMQ
ncbi:MAG: M6 family metalloprotease domain-containing protein [Holophagae bacterium]|nr:M6 family metalloprotease domain-containing protein [Holophagae bacterium]